MNDSPSDIVPFGWRYHFKRSARSILDLGGETEKEIPFADYMSLVNGRYKFTDDALALELFADEIEHNTIPDLRKINPKWAAVQVALPYLELIGKIEYAKNRDGKNFKAAAAKYLVPKSELDDSVSCRDYQSILAALWTGLRCGVSHNGFMQDSKGIDLQVSGMAGAPLIAFSKDGEDKVVEVGAFLFVERVIDGLEKLIAELRKNEAKRKQRFLPRWQTRWGSYRA